MSKNWTTRISDTISFVANVAIDGLQGDRQLVLDALKDWDQQTPTQERKALSSCMSQNGTLNRPKSKTDRAYRRALILLECAVGATPRNDWAGKVRKVNGYKLPQLPGLFKHAVQTKSDMLGSLSEYGRAMADELKAHPKRFLQSHRVVIGGKPESGVYGYAVYTQDGKLKINPNAGDTTYYELRAVNVPAQNYAKVRDKLGSITGTSANGRNVDVMFTTQFTGCAFCFAISGDNLMAAHINPGGAFGSGVPKAIEATDLPAVLRDDGAFSNDNGGAFKVYGRTADGGPGYPRDGVEQMTIVAVRKAASWRVYAQQAFAGGRLVVERIDEG